MGAGFRRVAKHSGRTNRNRETGAFSGSAADLAIADFRKGDSVMRRRKSLLSFVMTPLLVGGLSLASAAQPSGEDVVLKALGDELKRSMSLRLEGLDQPYFIQYAIDETTTYRVAATYGASVRSDQDHSRV